MKHRAHARFWRAYKALPRDIQQLADRSYTLLCENPEHPSLHFKKVGQFWSSRVGLRYRALALETEQDLVWFWVGTHADYDKLIGRKPSPKTRLRPESRARAKAGSKRPSRAPRG